MGYILGPDKWPVDEETGRRATYWETRRELVYYSALANFVRILGYDARSMIDVGSAGCLYLGWFKWIPEVVSLDLNYPSPVPGVRQIKADFLEWKPDRNYDLVTCCQVLEHIPDAGAFAKKLLTLGRFVLVSLPHKWPAGSVKTHIHDPVDQAKIDGWFGRAPDYKMTVREPFAEERLFCFYNMSGKPLNLSSIDLVNRLVLRPVQRT